MYVANEPGLKLPVRVGNWRGLQRSLDDSIQSSIVKDALHKGFYYIIVKTGRIY